MAQTIYIKEYDTEIEIPDGADMEQVQAALKKQFPPKNSVSSPTDTQIEPQAEPQGFGERLRGVARAAVPYARPALEMGGALGGAVLASPGNVIAPGAASLAGAGLGYAGGRRLARGLETFAGVKPPETLGQAFAGTARDIPMGMAMEAGGGIIGKPIGAALKYAGKVAPRLYESVAKIPPRSISKFERDKAIKAAFKYEIPATEKGISKSRRMIDDTNQKISNVINDMTKNKDILLKQKPVESKSFYGKKIVGYRYGKAPEGGKSFNAMTNQYEDGVSMASASGKKENNLLATLDAKAKKGKYYYEGDYIGTGGDDEPLLANVKKITEKQHKIKLAEKNNVEFLVNENLLQKNELNKEIERISRILKKYNEIKNPTSLDTLGFKQEYGQHPKTFMKDLKIHQDRLAKVNNNLGKVMVNENSLQKNELNKEIERISRILKKYNEIKNPTSLDTLGFKQEYGQHPKTFMKDLKIYQDRLAEVDNNLGKVMVNEIKNPTSLDILGFNQKYGQHHRLAEVDNNFGKVMVNEIKISDILKRLDDVKAWAKKSYADPTPINKMVDEYASGVKDARGENIAVKEAQKLKQGIYRRLSDSAYGEYSTPAKEIEKNFARGIKEELVKAYPVLERLNAKDSALIGLHNILEKSVNRIRNRDILGLAEYGGAIGGAELAGGPGATVGVIISKIMRSPAVASRLSFALNKASRKAGIPLAQRAVSYPAVGAFADKNDVDIPPLPNPGPGLFEGIAAGIGPTTAKAQETPKLQQPQQMNAEQQATQAYLAGDYDNAIAGFKQAIVENPEKATQYRKALQQIMIEKQRTQQLGGK